MFLLFPRKVIIVSKSLSTHLRVHDRLYSRDDSRFTASQWETVSLFNGVSHWLGARGKPRISPEFVEDFIYSSTNLLPAGVHWDKAFNNFKPEETGRHFPGYIFIYFFVNENLFDFYRILLLVINLTIGIGSGNGSAPG